MVTNPQFVALATRIVKLVAFRNLTWRWHGLGMLQAELDDSIRIHVWHESLRHIPADGMRAVHDHRFDIHSAIVYGTIIDTPYTVLVGAQPFAPRFATGFIETEAFAIKHAKIQAGEGTEGQLIGPAWAKPQVPRRYEAGQHYSIAHRDWHTSRVEALTVTVVYRCNFDDKPARVLGGMGGVVRHKMTWQDMPSECHDVLAEAYDAVHK